MQEQLENICNNNKNLLLSLIKKFETTDDNITLTESNGSSTVIISKIHTYIFQHYVSLKVFNNICDLMQKISSSHHITFTHDDFTFSYSLKDYITLFIDSINQHNTIIWEKIVPCNSLNYTSLNTFVTKNIYKIMWDIGKSLYGLHYNNYIHGDPTIDNIGIKNNTFILYDYDNSTKLKFENINSDYYKLNRSFSLYIDDKNICKKISYILNQNNMMLMELIKTIQYEHSFKNIEETFTYLNNLNIHY